MHTSWTTPQSNNRALLFLDNNGLSWTVSAPNKVTAVSVRRNGNFQTPISDPAVRPKRCHTLSNPAHRQDYTVACLNYTLQTMMPLPGWPVMAPNAYDNNNINFVVEDSINLQCLLCEHEVSVYMPPAEWIQERVWLQAVPLSPSDSDKLFTRSYICYQAV